jgi:hypothetical protein
MSEVLTANIYQQLPRGPLIPDGMITHGCAGCPNVRLYALGEPLEDGTRMVNDSILPRQGEWARVNDSPLVNLCDIILQQDSPGFNGKEVLKTTQDTHEDAFKSVFVAPYYCPLKHFSGNGHTSQAAAR